MKGPGEAGYMKFSPVSTERFYPLGIQLVQNAALAVAEGQEFLQGR